MKKILFTRPDGGVSVVHPKRNVDDIGLPDDYIEQRAFAKLPADAINPTLVDDVVIPTDRHFRDAWEHAAGTINTSMPKARGIHRNNLRALREPLFKKFDVDYMKALEDNDTAALATIKNKRQQLRDAPQHPAIDAATTPAELKVAIPAILQ